MPALGEVPFGRYYGTVDATPLFVMLAEAYVERTADLDLIDGLWPHIVAAIEWMKSSGDVDGDDFIEYARRSAPSRPSRSVRFRATRLRRGAARRGSQAYAVMSRPRPIGTDAPNACGRDSRRPSGARSWAPTRSRWIATSASAGSGAPTPATASSPGSSVPSAPGAWPPH